MLRLQRPIRALSLAREQAERPPTSCALLRMMGRVIYFGDIYSSMSSPSKAFKIGDHVRWNSEAGRVSGVIIRRVTSNTRFKGYTHHASKEEPQYFIKSDKTDHIAIHKGSALHLLQGKRKTGKR